MQCFFRGGTVMFIELPAFWRKEKTDSDLDYEALGIEGKNDIEVEVLPTLVKVKNCTVINKSAIKNRSVLRFKNWNITIDMPYDDLKLLLKNKGLL